MFSNKLDVSLVSDATLTHDGELLRVKHLDHMLEIDIWASRRRGLAVRDERMILAVDENGGNSLVITRQRVVTATSLYSADDHRSVLGGYQLIERRMRVEL